MTYLTAVKAAGTDDSEKVLGQLRSMKINDMFATDGYIRPDGRMVHAMYLARVKSPAKSKYPWDYLKLVEKIQESRHSRRMLRASVPRNSDGLS
jgi:branched-chain amino acid transport system substrate-binding protein